MNAILRLPLAMLIALGATLGAHAQDKPRGNSDSTVLPVWNRGSGKVEALLYLEPTGEQTAGARWHFGRNSLDAAFGLSSGDSLGLLCNSSRGGSISGLASHCMLASLGDDDADSRHLSANATFNRTDGRFGLSTGTGRDTLPAWLAGPVKAPAARMEQNDLTVFGQKNIGSEGFVSIAGTYAKARLIPLSDVSPALLTQWDSKSLNLGGGYGAFSANIVGRVIDAPGQAGKWEGLGLGVTWRTPWSGQLTVGAENIITRGKNPFSPRNEGNDDGAIPYVRYEQDL